MVLVILQLQMEFLYLKNYNDPAQLVIDPSDNTLSIFERGESPARQK